MSLIVLRGRLPFIDRSTAARPSWIMYTGSLCIDAYISLNSIILIMYVYIDLIYNIYGI